jgi:hypothetical protein
MSPPVHPQLMDPADDPEAFIAASIYWYPSLFPTRTEVLDHTLLCNGNGYEWDADGWLCSVFAHIEPDYDRLDHYEAEAREYEARAHESGSQAAADVFLEMAGYQRAEHERLLAIRADYRNRARTYGPVRATEQLPGTCERGARMIGTRELSWTLLGRALKIPNDRVAAITGPPPERIAPAWQRVIDETRLLFTDILTEQSELFLRVQSCTPHRSGDSHATDDQGPADAAGP